MRAKAQVLGHSVHQMLIVFPVGLLTTSVVFDLAFMAGEGGVWPQIAFWTIAAGLVGGAAAAPFGVADWLAIPGGTRAKGVGLRHALANGVFLGFFAASLWLRRGGAHEPSALALGLSFSGLVIGTMGAWLGGELVDRLGVGVEEGAHLDSPSSLSRRPAAETAGR